MKRIKWEQFIIAIIRWFEEARVNLLDQLGIGYDVMEKAGIISNVV